MKISHDKTHPFVKEVYYPELLSRKCMHFINFGCWFFMIFLGTILLGLSTSNNSVTIDVCTDTQSFCSHNLLINASGTYNLYLKLTNFHQNNREYFIFYSVSWMRTAFIKFMGKLTTLIDVGTSTLMEVWASVRQWEDTE